MAVSDIPGNGRGHAKVDWQQAEAFYLALDPPRSYSKVAREYRVTPAAVRKQALRRNWLTKAESVDRQALAGIVRRVAKSRGERVEQALRIVDRYLDRYEQELDDHELKPGELRSVVQLAELLVGGATDRLELGAVQEIITALLDRLIRRLPPGERAAAFADVDEVTQGLVAIEGGRAA